MKKGRMNVGRIKERTIKPQIYISIRPYIGYIMLATLASIGVTGVNVGINSIIKNQINGAINQGRLIGELALIFFLGMIANYYMVYLNGFYSNHIMTDLRKKVMNHMKKVSIGHLSDYDYHDMISRMSSDMDSLSSYAQQYLKECIHAPVMILIFSVFLWMQNKSLFVMTLIPLFIIVPLSVWLMSPVKFRQRAYGQELAHTNKEIQQICEGHMTLKALRIEFLLLERYQKKLTKALILSKENDLRQYMLAPLSQLIVYLPVVICLTYGGRLVMSGKLGLGTLIIYSNMLRMLIVPLREFYQLFVNSKVALVSLERIVQLLELLIESKNIKEELRKKPEYSKTLFEFNQVSYSYSPDKPVLSELTFSMERGKRYAIVGESGSGKSTLLKLLYGHCQEYKGRLTMWGKELKDLDIESVREQMALISQETYLFPVTVMDNLCLSRQSIGEEEAIIAAKTVGAHDFIQAMEKGYETPLNEAGRNLSGGQKQRLAIARAILKQADIILMDEPTSALDRALEQLIQEMTAQVFRDKTVITIAHRLPTIQDYDCIFVLKKGKIIAQGKHEKLLLESYDYGQMWQHFYQDVEGQYE